MSAHPVAAGNGNGDAILGVFGHLVNWHARGYRRMSIWAYRSGVEGSREVAHRFNHGIESLASWTSSGALQPRLRLGM